MSKRKSEIIFPSAYKGGRPIRLSEATRRFAYESLHDHKYGLMTKSVPWVAMDDVEGYEAMTPLEKYDAIIRRIVETAPLRVCDGELVSGAATLGKAIAHLVPASYKGEKTFASISHLTVDFPSVLKRGTDAIRADVEEAARCPGDEYAAEFYRSAINTLDSMDILHERYMRELIRLGRTDVAEKLKNVPNKPAADFYEGVQSIWFTFAFLRLCGNWPGIGRIDEMLGGLLDRDLKSGALDLDRAREILAHMFIKGCEWVTGDPGFGGDAQHYQNIVLSGIDENGKDVTNEVTYLVLDIIDELSISDFPVTVRVNEHTDKKLLRRMAETIRHGGGVVAVYGEETVLEALRRLGYPQEEARKFANDGCWEVQIPGKTFFTYLPFDALAILQKITLKNYEPDVCPTDFEELYGRFCSDLRAEVATMRKWNESYALQLEKPTNRNVKPCTAVSLFEQGCIRRGRLYDEFGPDYEVISPHIGGFADVVNSLFTIKKLVYDDKKLSFDEFMRVLKNDWEGAETLRTYCLNRYTYFGNDSDESDALAARLMSDFANICDELGKDVPFRFPGGVSTFGRQIAWAHDREACPFGRKKHEVLAANCSPTPGTAREGATAVIRSYCKCDLAALGTGSALDIRLLPNDVAGESGLDAIVGLIEGFVKLGGFFMQMDVADPEVLRDAQAHPEDHLSLSVRVSGWNARFVTLDREWQDMIINDISGKGV